MKIILPLNPLCRAQRNWGLLSGKILQLNDKRKELCDVECGECNSNGHGDRPRTTRSADSTSSIPNLLRYVWSRRRNIDIVSTTGFRRRSYGEPERTEPKWLEQPTVSPRRSFNGVEFLGTRRYGRSLATTDDETNTHQCTAGANELPTSSRS